MGRSRKYMEIGPSDSCPVEISVSVQTTCISSGGGRSRRSIIQYNVSVMISLSFSLASGLSLRYRLKEAKGTGVIASARPSRTNLCDSRERPKHIGWNPGKITVSSLVFLEVVEQRIRVDFGENPRKYLFWLPKTLYHDSGPENFQPLGYSPQFRRIARKIRINSPAQGAQLVYYGD
jgi:hypothetical protein